MKHLEKYLVTVNAQIHLSSSYHDHHHFSWSKQYMFFKDLLKTIQSQLSIINFLPDNGISKVKNLREFTSKNLWMNWKGTYVAITFYIYMEKCFKTLYIHVRWVLIMLHFFLTNDYTKNQFFLYLSKFSSIVFFLQCLVYLH